MKTRTTFSLISKDGTEKFVYASKKELPDYVTVRDLMTLDRIEVLVYENDKVLRLAYRPKWLSVKEVL